MAAIALASVTLVACGGKKNADDSSGKKAETGAVAATGEVTEGVNTYLEDLSGEEGAIGSVMPASPQVEGALAGIVELEMTPSTFIPGEALGKSYYYMAPTFKILKPQQFKGEIELYCEFYDEDGNLIEFQTENGEYSQCQSASEGFLQMAIAKNKTCNKTSVLISELVNPEEQLMKAKTYKVYTKIYDDLEFDYTDDLYQ